jgi:hypothetical protein
MPAQEQYVGMRELWGTFSVRDHLDERPFVADLMLYDRLIVPVPADPKERERWERPDLAWDPGWQSKVLDTVHRLEKKSNQQLIIRVPWNEHRRQVFKDTLTRARAAGMEVDGYQWTAGQLLSDDQVKRAASAGPTKPRVVAAYVSREAFEKELVVEEVTTDDAAANPPDAQQLAMAVGRRFLVPDAGGAPSEERDLELVERAARLVTKASFRDKRAAYNDWVERAVRERLTTKEALGKMKELLDAYELEVRAEKAATRFEQAFLFTGVALGVAGHFFPPIWLGNVMLAPVHYLLGREFSTTANPADPAAMFHEATTELRLAPAP